jgi:hypothetical protein
MRFSRGLSLIGLLAIGGVASAADAPAAPADAPKPAVPSVSDVLDAWGLSLTGYVSATYDYSTSPVPLLQEFNFRHNSFVLNQASFTLAKQPKEGFGALVQVIAGEDARVLNASSTFNQLGTPSTFNITQAFVQYASGIWTVQGGKMLTLAGAEVIAPTGNTNISRSLLFFTEPLTHTGLRVTAAVNDKFSFIFGVNNGWNWDSDPNSQKTGEIGISWTPVKAFVLTAQGYFGSEPVNGTDGERSLVDLVGTWNINDATSVVLSADWGKQDNGVFTAGETLASAKWEGIAGYFNYAINGAWRMSLRAEYLKDTDGFQTGVVQNVKEATLTFGYSPVKSFELRFEGRYDKSDQDYFVKDITGGTETFQDNQSHFLIEGLYKF